MTAALLIDFGSTYTKLRAIDVDARRILAQRPGTVDRHDGHHDRHRRRACRPRAQARRPACLQVPARLLFGAGGLRMVTVGLVRELTAEAARQAALGAGAKLVGTFAYRLTPADDARIDALAPDILLLAGGTDGGNSEVIRHNAARLAAVGARLPDRARRQPRRGRGRASACSRSTARPPILTENVMPEFNVLDIEPARAAIRQVFIDRIVHAKGIDRAAARVRPRADADAGRGAGRRAPARRRRGGTPGSARCSSSTSAAPRPTCIRSRRASRHARRRSRRAARAAREAHRRGRPRHAPQRRGDRRGGGRRCHRAERSGRARRSAAASWPRSPRTSSLPANAGGGRARRGAGLCRRAPCGETAWRHGRRPSTPCTARSSCSAARTCPTSPP